MKGLVARKRLLLSFGFRQAMKLRKLKYLCRRGHKIFCSRYMLY